MAQLILEVIILIISMTICLIFWHKKINPKTTWIYAIHCLVTLIMFLIFAEIDF